MKAMTKEHGKITTETDKSSKFLLTDQASYVVMAGPQHKDRVITQDVVVTIEGLMNGHNYHICRIFGVCTGWDDGKRMKRAMTNKNLPLPC